MDLGCTHCQLSDKHVSVRLCVRLSIHDVFVINAKKGQFQDFDWSVRQSDGMPVQTFPFPFKTWKLGFLMIAMAVGPLGHALVKISRNQGVTCMEALFDAQFFY